MTLNGDATMLAGLIIGIAVGSVVFCACIIVCVLWCLKDTCACMMKKTAVTPA